MILPRPIKRKSFALILVLFCLFTGNLLAETNALSRQLNFVNDVLPVLSKAGCNAGKCHAKPEGQNGFKLSVFAYDPQSDYEQIVQESRGRRVFPAAPEESLILLKP